MSINKEELLHLADLAKLSFSDSEVDKLISEFDSIIAFANTINDSVVRRSVKLQSDTEGTVDYSLLREDTVVDSLDNETILSNIDGENGFFTAKRCVQ